PIRLGRLVWFRRSRDGCFGWLRDEQAVTSHHGRSARPPAHRSSLRVPMTPRVYEFLAIAIAIVLLGTLGYLIITGHKLLLSSGQPVVGYCSVFWCAGRAALEGLAAHVHDHDVIARYHQQAVPGVAFIAP